jgi:hypothetical protein
MPRPRLCRGGSSCKQYQCNSQGQFYHDCLPFFVVTEFCQPPKLAFSGAVDVIIVMHPIGRGIELAPSDGDPFPIKDVKFLGAQQNEAANWGGQKKKAPLGQGLV